MSKLNIFFVTFEDSGVGLYRVIQPCHAIGQQKLANVKNNQFTGDSASQVNALGIIQSPEAMESWQRIADWADVIFASKPKNHHEFALLGGMKDRGKCKLVIDVDDNFRHVNQDNPGYSGYAEDNPDTHRRFIEAGIGISDALCVSVNYLVNEYDWYKKPIFVNPNGVDFSAFYKDKEVKKHKGKKVRIGFSGAAGHHFDLDILKRVIPELKKKFNIEFWTLGQIYNHSYIDRSLDFVPLAKYPDALCATGFDIGVAPLRDNTYNRCKSNLRVIEYSACKIPTVCSNIVTYEQPKNTLKCSDDADEWIKALSILIEDKGERERLAVKAYNEVKRNFSVKKQAKPLVDFLSSL